MAIVWLLLGVAIGVLVTVVVRRPSVPVEVPSASVAEPPSATADTSDDDRLRQALDALPVGVVVADRSGAVVFRNAMSSGVTGTTHADVLVEEAVQAHLAGAVAGQAQRQVIDLFGPPRVVAVVHARPLEDGAVLTIEDITERSRLDAVRTDFVANVSHELKTPVGAIAVLAEALIDEDDPSVVRRFVAKMVSEAHRVGRTIDDLLELSRIELGGEAVRQRVDVDGVIAEAVERAQSMAAGRSIRIVTEHAGDLFVVGDRRQLASALGNLVENAVKYSHDAGTVAVTARKTGDLIDISVADTGVGIPQRDLDRIFERFYRVDRARSRETGGTGLGLAIVRHVATNHGGDVTVASHEGEGSTFTLHLPSTATDSKEIP